MLSDNQKKMLTENLLSSNVKDRTQGGRKVSYIEGWWAISEANRIFGPDMWDRETIEMNQVDIRERAIGNQGKAGWEANYISKVRVRVRTDHDIIIKEGWGFGQGIDQNLGMAIESAVKEAETDAMKRAMMMFGNPFGLALYDKDKANVSNVNTGRIDEFREALEVVTSGQDLAQLVREYTGDILDLKIAKPDEWAILNKRVAERTAEFKKARLEQAAKDNQNDQADAG